MLARAGFSLIRWLDTRRRPGETLYETAKREITTEAMSYSRHDQVDAAQLVHCTPRVMQYNCKDLQLRPKDRRKERQ